jgi:integrase
MICRPMSSCCWRHTGMRIGECADLSFDCLHNVGPDRWAIHVPLGKLKTERMVPVDSFVCELARIFHQVLAKAEFRGITEFPDNS